MTPRSIHQLTVATCAALALVTGLSRPSAQGPTYEVTDLGTLGGTRSAAFGINSAGHIVGYSDTAEGHQHAFLYNGGSLIDLGTLGGENSYANRINDLGMVVGRAETEEGEYRPFIARAGMPMFDLSSLDQVLRGPFAIATAINNLGQVVGYRQTPQHHKAARNRVFLYSDFMVTDLGAFGGEDGVATAINEAGQIAGSLGTEPHADYADHKAFLVTDGKMIVLGTLGGRLRPPSI